MFKKTNYLLLWLVIGLLSIQCQNGIFKPEAPESTDGFQGKLETHAGIYAALKPDHSLWIWGDNRDGTIGNGTTISSTKPIQVDISPVVAFDLWLYCIVAADSSGDIWYWGNPEIWWTENVLQPIKISHIDGAIDVIMSGSEAFILDDTGTIWYLGFRFPNETPYSEWINPVNFATIPGASTITENIALLQNGSIVGYGLQDPLRGGISNTISGVTCVAADYGFHAVMAKKDGTVWKWGKITREDGTGLSTATPVQVLGLKDVTALDVIFVYNIALQADGTVWYWWDGPIWNILPANPTPQKIPRISRVVSVAIGAVSGSFEALLKQQDGTYWIFRKKTEELIPVIWD